MLTSGRMTEASQWGNRTSLKACTKGGTFLEPMEVKTEPLWRPVGTPEMRWPCWSGVERSPAGFQEQKTVAGDPNRGLETGLWDWIPVTGLWDWRPKT